MTWLVIPQASIFAILFSKSLRMRLAALLPNIESSLSTSVVLDDGSRFTVQELSQGLILIAAWSSGESQNIAAGGQPSIALLNSSGESTVASLPEEELVQVLERLCLLAELLWSNTPVPDLWRPKKITDCQTVFASARLKDVRVAYALQKVLGFKYLTIGTVFYSGRQQKAIKVPKLDVAKLNGIPVTLEPPSDGSGGAVFESDVPALESDDPDVLINRGRGEDRHLFSMSRSDWMVKGSPLTTQQRRIINEKKCPLRIHGPGGSGKTLVLILKALGLLSAAANTNTTCQILMILHNNEVRDNVRAAIEAIDEGGFLATTKQDDQCFDVDTLHGWCMRVLRIDTGGFDYALHADPITSKKKQDEILGNVVGNAIGNRLPNMRTLLSTDLCAHLDGPRDKLISNVRYEIAIRIKGRGFRDEQHLYVESPLKSFVGPQENRHDRYFLFKIAEEYEKELRNLGRLDSDDIVLDMQSRLAAPLWDRHRKTAGYDFVFVDETHLFNENERRVLPYLTRGSGGNVPIIMTFDESQSIGGQRVDDMEKIGIRNSEQRRLSYVHRSSPEIYRLARDLVERSSLVFSEFSGSESMARMSEKDIRKCRPPAVVYSRDDAPTAEVAVEVALRLRSQNYPRVGIIAFYNELIPEIAKNLESKNSEGRILNERGDSVAGKPFPGIFVMSPENSGGLEFDAVVLTGVENGRVPPSLHNISPQGHFSVREESCKELYTALTRARYHVVFVYDRSQGPSEFIRPWINFGLIKEQKPS